MQRTLEKVDTRKKRTINQINELVKSLTSKEQNALLSALKKKYLLDQARKLDKAVRKNTLAIQKIVEEVCKVRSTKIW